MLLVRHNTRLLMNVTVTRPTAKMELPRRRGAALACAGAAEKRAHKTYDAACERDGSKMVPFAMESYGAQGKPADASEELSAQSFLLDASSALSVRCNARQRGHHCSQHAGAAHATGSDIVAACVLHRPARASRPTPPQALRAAFLLVPLALA